MDILNALVAFLNFIVVPGLAYGSQLALGALGITLIALARGDRFEVFSHTDRLKMEQAHVG